MIQRILSCAIAVLSLGLLNTHAQARNWQEGVAATHTLDGRTMAYRYYLPKNYDANLSYPLVLFLHGSGERGGNNVTQVSNHIAGLIDKTEVEFPAILVAPQAPSSTNWSTNSTRELTEDIVERIKADFTVDADRLYLTGLSMGGFGTLEYLDYYTNIEPGIFEFAAAAPMSAGIGGVIDLSHSAPWRDTPIWLMHGDRDTTVSVDLSRNAFRSIAGLRAEDPIDFNAIAFASHPTAIADNVRYTEIVRGGHVIWSPIYRSDEFYAWMFSQSLPIPEPTSLLLVTIGLACTASRPKRNDPVQM